MEFTTKAKSERSKLLAAAAVLVMVACAFCVLAPVAEAADTEVKEADFRTDISDGEYTVSGNQVVNLTNPLELEKATTINGSGSLTINYTPKAQLDVAINMGATGATLTVTGGADVTVVVNAPADSALKANQSAGLSVLGASEGKKTTNGVTVSDGSTLTITQSVDAHGVSWRAGKLTVDNATVNFYHANSTGSLEVDAKNGANLVFTPNTGVTAGNLKGSVVDSNVTVVGQDTKLNLYTVDVSGSSVTGATTLGLYEGADVTATGASISATNINVMPSSSDDSSKATVTGGSVSGNFAKTEAVSTPTFEFNGTTVSGSASEGATITAGTNGIIVEGSFDASAATVNGSGSVVVSSGSSAQFKTGTNNVKAAPGATVSGITPAEISANAPLEADDPDLLVSYAKAEGVIVKATSNITLNKDLVIGNGTTVNGDTYKITLGTNKIVSDGIAKLNSKVEGTDAEFTLALNGSFSIRSGSVYIDGAELSGDDNKVTVTSGQIVISGVLNGTLKIDASGLSSGTAHVVFENFTVNTGATLVLDSSAYVEYDVKGNFYLYGSVIASDEKDEITLFVQNKATFKAFNGANIQQTVTVKAADGATDAVIDLGDSMGTLTINDDVRSSNTYSQTQTLVIGSTLNLMPNTTTTILGQLVINDGVVLTVMNGAKLVLDSETAKMLVNGQIEIDDGGIVEIKNGESVTVNGEIVSDGTLTINSNVTVENGGKILVDNGEKSTITTDAKSNFVVKNGGELEVRGQMFIAAIKNEGTVTLNGAVLTGNSIISMAANGAVVDVMSFTSKATETLTVTDKGLVIYDDKSAEDKDIIVGTTANYGVNSIILSDSNASGAGLRGITITENITSQRVDDEIVYDWWMNVSGTPVIVDEGTGNIETYTFELNGVDIRVAAETELTLGAGVTLKNSGTLTVDGTLYAVNAKSAVTNEGTIYVSGMVQTIKEIDSGINAATYQATVSGVQNYYYTTLNTAVANGAKDIEIMGTVKVLENLDIPTGTTVKADGNAALVIGSTEAEGRDVVVTVADGATVRNFTTGKITVDGTLEFANAKDSKSNTIVSDVSVAAEPGVSYTNIYTALENADSGETVTITRTDGPVKLNADIEVKTGVTLVIPVSRTLEVGSDVTVTVNGTVQMLGVITSETGYKGFAPVDDGEYSQIVVNGTLMAMSAIPYAATDSAYGYYIAGAYYNIVNTAGNWWYVTPVEQAAAVSNDVAKGAITINGKNTVSDVTFTGDETTAVAVTLNEGAVLNAGTVTLARASLNAMNGEFTGTVATAVGSVAFVNATDFAVADTYVEDAETMTLEGTPAQADAEGAKCTVNVASGNVTVAKDLTVNDVTLSSFSISEGATVTVTGAGKLTAKNMTVDGTLVATDKGTVEVTGVLTVRGTFTVAQKTEDNEAGVANVAELFVGIAKDAKNGTYGSESAATVNADTIGKLTRVIVSAESTVNGKLTDNMDTTEFYVEDALWITVSIGSTYNGAEDVIAYTSGDKTAYNYLPGDLTESKFLAWNDADGKAVAVGSAAIGASNAKVYADIDYNVYNVTIRTDGGIASVAIDGNLLTQQFGSNTFVTADGLKAGQHTVTYTLKSGFTGSAVLTADGVSVSGMNFTLSGDFSKQIVLNLAGTEASQSTVVIDNGGDSGMGLTDYLLIVLVVLIVIMAIIVAMRLMRS